MTRLTVGLTGGIASGKSLVAECFEVLGVPVLDADLVAREIVAPGTPALAQIARTFGPDYLLADGQLDRRRLREAVFADRKALRQLEAITHPPMRARMIAWRDACTAPYCILSVAILLEAGMRNLVDRVLVVDAPRELQLQRLAQRDGVSLPLAEQMLAAQASRESRLAAADEVIVNDGSSADIEAAVRDLHHRYLLIARGPARASPHP